MLKLETAKQIGVRIDGVSKAITGLNALVHATAVQCMLHAEKHGDVTLMGRLVATLNGYNQKGLRFWASKYSPITWNGDGKVKLQKKSAKTYNPFDCEAANANPFWTLKEVKDDQNRAISIGSDTVIRMIVNNAHKATEAMAGNGTVKGDKNKLAKLVAGMVKLASEIDPEAFIMAQRAVDTATDKKTDTPAVAPIEGVERAPRAPRRNLQAVA